MLLHKRDYSCFSLSSPTGMELLPSRLRRTADLVQSHFFQYFLSPVEPFPDKVHQTPSLGITVEESWQKIDVARVGYSFKQFCYMIFQAISSTEAVTICLQAPAEPQRIVLRYPSVMSSHGKQGLTV